MNQQKLVLLTAILMLSIYSCKKDTNPTVSDQAPSYLNFSQLKVGNYWVYQEFEIDANGNAAPTNTYDSCYVEKDTLINSKTYYKIIKPNLALSNQMEISFQKDSLHYVVNSEGTILFSYQDFSSALETNYIMAGANDTVCQIVKQMDDKNLVISTPAGPFTTSNAKETYLMFPGWASAENPRYKNTRYAENIGIVVETLPFYFSNPSYIERRLVRFHVN